ncbi:MAG: efflux RND transporter periplasmic adaptor subunit [Pseudomonadota bacterium]
MASPDLSRLTIDRGAKPQALRPRRRWLRLGLVLVPLAAAGAVLLRALSGAPTVETVTASPAYPSQSFTLLNATGYVVAQRKAALSSKATGRLEWLGVLEGSHVKQGEVVARLENRDVSAALAQAEANVALARANLEQASAEQVDAASAQRRSAELLAQKFIPQATYDAAQARANKAAAAVSASRAGVAAAQASARVAQVALDQTLIRAPFDAVVLTKNANVGDNITPFSSAADSKGAVVTVADMDTLEVEADVSESNLAKIHVGQPAEILLDAFPDLRLAGVVSRTVPTVDRSKATLLVKVRFAEHDARILPDMSAKVAFLSKPVAENEKKPVLAVPPAALLARGGRQLAFVVRDGKLHEVAVTKGRTLGELLEVGGLAAGDKVVLNPAPALADGMAVNLVKK